MLPILLLVLAPQQSGLSDAPPPTAWATLTIEHGEHGAGRTRTTFEFGSSAGLGTNAATRHWVRRTFRGKDGDPMVTWASSDTCPGVGRAVWTASDVPSPKPWITPEGDVIVMLDGRDVAYQLEMALPGEGNGRRSIATNAGTALATWADRVETEITPCLSGKVPF